MDTENRKHGLDVTADLWWGQIYKFDLHCGLPFCRRRWREEYPKILPVNETEQFSHFAGISQVITNCIILWFFVLYEIYSRFISLTDVMDMKLETPLLWCKALVMENFWIR